jgi:signal transduction histidine kinase
VVCESLTNAVRHAGECTVRVDVRGEADWLRVRVADDGAGSEQLSQPSSLRGLRDRVTALGGEDNRRVLAVLTWLRSPDAPHAQR